MSWFITAIKSAYNPAVVWVPVSPMSEVAGRMAVQAGAHCLEKALCGRGVLLGGVPGVALAHVVIMGKIKGGANG